MNTKITIGITVHATSTGALCVNVLGVGLAFRLYRTITYANRPRTKTVIAVMIIKTIPSNHCKSRASFVAAG